MVVFIVDHYLWIRNDNILSKKMLMQLVLINIMNINVNSTYIGNAWKAFFVKKIGLNLFVFSLSGAPHRFLAKTIGKVSF